MFTSHDDRNTDVAFYLEHAGASWIPEIETEQEGTYRNAAELAFARGYADRQGWYYSWDDDPEDIEWGDIEPSDEDREKALNLFVTLKDQNGVHLASLGGIIVFSEDDPYLTVVEAELAAEAAPHNECLSCGRKWIIPTPASRCPFEAHHEEDDEDAAVTYTIDPNLLVQKYADIPDVSEGVHHFEGRIMVEGASNTAGYTFVYVPPTGKCRREHQGPIESGPYVGMVPLCSVIDNFGGTGAEIQRAEADGKLLRVKVGDTLRLPCGTEFVLSVNRFRDLKAEKSPLSHVMTDEEREFINNKIYVEYEDGTTIGEALASTLSGALWAQIGERTDEFHALVEITGIDADVADRFFQKVTDAFAKALQEVTW